MIQITALVTHCSSLKAVLATRDTRVNFAYK